MLPGPFLNTRKWSWSRQPSVRNDWPVLGKTRTLWEIETTAAGETIGRAELGGALGGILIDKMGFVRCNAARHSFIGTAADRMHGVALEWTKTFMKGLSRQIEFKGVTGANGENCTSTSTD